MIDDRKIDLNLLAVFHCLMSELNATRAAEKLGVSQSAVSASLAKLRQIYGDPLLVRTQRGLRPTPQAVLLHPRIAEALALIGGTLGGVSPSRSVVVRLGLSDDFEMAYGARLIAGVAKRAPEARLVLRQTNSTVAAAALNGREIDLALSSGTGTDSRLKHESLGECGFSIVFDRSVRGSDSPLSLEEYLARPHLLVSYSGLTGLTDDVLAEHGLRRSVAASTTHFAALPFLLRGTEQIATIPHHAAEAILATGPFGLSSCPLPFPRYAFGLSWRFDAIRQPAVLQVRDMIASLLR
jgi:DNA-binding transcriptional LysR family regulator